MQQILQNIRNGQTSLTTVAAPCREPGHVLIRTTRTLVSQGTEKMLVQFGKASLLQKARSKPDKVKQVLAKIRTDGLMPTIDAVFRKLDEPLPLGYCNAGVVMAVGEGVAGFQVGDRVASNGPHAEFVSVPANLVARIPEGVSDDAGAFTVIGAIGLQGIRLAKPELGERVVVIGLGLIGQITAQLLKAHGCAVIGFDYSGQKVETARAFGIEAYQAGGELDAVKTVLHATGGLGADAVLITASTSSHDVIRQSAQMSRKRGRIILVGVVGLNLERADFYEKELTFQVSCSYGPGRYDDSYEEKGYDYPPAFVRWTENRNFQAVLAAMAAGALKVEPLITKRAPLERYSEIYDNMDGDGLASLLVYDAPKAAAGDPQGTARGEPRVPAVESGSLAAGTTLRVSATEVTGAALAVVGAGNFTKMTAMPALVAGSAPVKYIVSSGGVTGTALAKKYNVPFSSTDFSTVLADTAVRGVILTTRHNLHASQTVAALRAGKQVLVEKPLCLTSAELKEIEAALVTQANSAALAVTVGFNRRFSPHIEKVKALLGDRPAPLSFMATINAGAIPLNHWVHDTEVGGGRLVGEGCHFIDLALFVTGSPIVAVSAVALGSTTDSAAITLQHENGSTSVINYLANGHREVSKERIEVHSQGRTLLLDNFCELRGHGFRSFSKLRTKLDKGHARQFALFAQRVKENGPPLIPWSEVVNSARATLALPRAIAERRWVRVDEV